MKKILILHASLLAVIVALGAFTYFRYWNIATVNGVSISRLDYYKVLDRQGGKQILDLMIDDALVLKEGRDKGVVIDKKVIDDEIAKIEEMLKSQNQTLDSALLATKMTRSDLEEQIKIKNIETSLSAPKTEITQAQVDQFLTANKSMLPTGKTKDELKELAKAQLTQEAAQTAASTWLDGLRQSAKIVYR